MIQSDRGKGRAAPATAWEQADGRQGESQAVSQPVNDKEERLAQALRANLHRRKAQSRARRTVEDDRARHEDSLKATATPSTGAEQDHGQAED